jgi:lipopolysaccharide/colanic/teichoic acid biosynthesis glycosyltransferase
MQAMKENSQLFRVLYIDDDDKRTKAFRQSFHPQIEVIDVFDNQAAVCCLDDSQFIDLIVYSDTLDTQGFLSTLKARRNWTKIPIILLTDRETVDLTADPYHGYIIDAFPFNYLKSTFQIRLDYLIHKKTYQQNAESINKSKKVRMPVGKRAFDIGLSLLLLIMASPLLLLVMVLIKLDSPGAILYSSKRVGMGFRIFNMYKLRTMRMGSDKLLATMASQNMYGSVAEEKPVDFLCEDCQLAGRGCQRPLFLDQKQICEIVYQGEQQAKAMFSKFKEDPRVTRLGKILRNTSIDELPQLFNILRGDMSFVGNRPLPLYEAEKLTNIGYARRFAAPAGLTGLWQVTKRGKAAVSDQERIHLDVLYAKRFSFREDMIILLRTFKAVWQKENV